MKWLLNFKAIRSDWGIFLTLIAKYPGDFLNVLKYAPAFSKPFNLDELGVKNEFLRNYLDMLAFLLQGLPASEFVCRKILCNLTILVELFLTNFCR